MKKILLPVSDSLKARLDQKRREGYAFTASFSRCWSGRATLGKGGLLSGGRPVM